MGKNISLEYKKNIAVLTFNNESGEMNVLSEVVLREFSTHLAEIKDNSSCKGLVIISGKKDFIVGADIKEIEKLKSEQETKEACLLIQEMFTDVSKLKIPTVAAINGNCLGGGLELALACTWRIGTNNKNTVLALPEIQLGLLPGAGGTQRLPRLIGIQSAFDMILTGKRVRADKALKLGLLDAKVPEKELLEYALQFASKKKNITDNQSYKKKTQPMEEISHWALEGNFLGRRLIEKKVKEMVDKTTKGFYPAPYKAIKAVLRGMEMSLEEGLKLEAQLFAELSTTKESKSLIHLFHSVTEAKKHDYKDEAKKVLGDNLVPQDIGILGAGFMGTGIGTVLADKNIRVMYSESSQEMMGKSLKYSYDYFAGKLRKKRIKPFELGKKMAFLSPGLSPKGFHRAPLVIEAVNEDLGLKQKLLAAYEKNAPENWIFATNTSAIPISQIASGCEHPEQVLGMHFFSPVEKMPLLEIVITDKTAGWATARAVAVGHKMGKQVIIVKDSPGFYTTRALSFYIAEAAQMLMEGVPMDHIDKALLDAGFAVGAITLIDEVGIDVGSHVLKTMTEAFGDRISTPANLKAVLDSGRKGRKNQKGFYLYEDGKKTTPDNEVYKLSGVTPNNMLDTKVIVDRCILAFVNEAARCLEEGILRHGYDGDIGAVFGLGFPAFWGGPFRYVDHLGAKEIVERLEGLTDKYGKRFTPAKILKDYAKGNKKFFPEESN